ncbi:MAG: sigma-70 family RNA polymerase sigma factor [Verrucomicrobiota bacterium]|nr:sigma-70 family RNA polymerase sigma factor [Verrucomicrobiota bacterium]
MERLIAGQDAALNDLMERHAAKLFNFFIRCLQNEEDAADTAQETFVRVYQNKNRFDRRQKFTTWLYAIASNLVKDRYRWRSRHPTVSLDAKADDQKHDFRDFLPDQKPSPSETAQNQELKEAVRRAVAQLPEELRLPLILSEYEEKSHSQIGAILGCSAKAIETRIYRARQRLREPLADALRAT